MSVRRGVLVLALLAGCEQAAHEPFEAPQALGARPFAAAVQLERATAVPAGELRGRVRFVGQAPPRRLLAVGGASGCGGEELLGDELIVTGEGVANALVHARSLPPACAIAPPPSTPLVLDQEHCVYRPHVVALRAGQPLEISSSDGVTHNVNAKPARNQRFNLSQTPGAPPIEARFERGELSIPLSCDIHPWMSARVHVLEHDAFALSAADGSFAIRALAPGRYRFEVLHEVLGAAEFELELDSAAGAFASIEFRRAGAAAH